MSEYRRNRVHGGCYFFTVNLADRRTDLLVTHVDTLRHCVSETRTRRPFHIDAWVVLADHMHCIWTLPVDDDDFSGRWREIKKSFSRMLPNLEERSVSRARRGERGI